MELDEYQLKARAFATAGGLKLEYALLGLAEESGEACGKAAKFVRRTNLQMADITYDDETRGELIAELGDCLWMIANAAACIDVNLDALAHANLSKLEGRRQRGTIVGEGDYR